MKKLTRDQVIEKLEKDDKDFRGLDLSGLILCNMDLSNADLRNADLSSTDLYNTDLYNANLSYANLIGADLECANLSYANLIDAKLSNTNLSSTTLSNANLSNTDLSNVKLSNADLCGANLAHTLLSKEEQIRTGIILKESMIGYKNCERNKIVTLEIPKGAIVFSINNNQCRTNKAKVIDISSGEKIVYSDYDESFAYELGKEIEIENFDLRYNVECSTGIHFYRTKKEAERCF